MSVSYRTDSYGGILTQTASLIGIDVSSFQSTEQVMLNSFFNRSLRKIWEAQTWIDICPNGEVRFPSNLIGYPNDLTQASVWKIGNGSSVLTGTVLTANAVTNPLDNRTTATQVLEDSTNAVHYVATLPNLTFIPSQPYTTSGYVYPNGRNFILVQVFDGSAEWNTYFNLTTPGSVGTLVNIGGSAQTASIQVQANGWYYWSVNLTTSSSAVANAGQVYVGLSPDGVTNSYTGNTSLGANMWGITSYLQQGLLPQSYVIPYVQNGETAIESTGIFGLSTNNPYGSLYPYSTGYTLSPTGIQLIGATSGGPYYLYYRPQRPGLPSSSWSSSATYTVNATVLYTTTAGVQNGYTANGTTSAGQSPDTNPSSWSVIPIPYIFGQYMAWYAYSQWLQSEGQAAKAQAAMAIAQGFMDDENDKQERQAGVIMPWRVSTHVTSQNRGMGYQGFNFSPSGTPVIN